MRRVAVIGSGISGLAVAHALAGQARVTLFEAGSYFGGHTNTVDMTLDGVTHGVDTGFLVLNERTYPNLLRLFEQLGVAIAPSEMSFSVQVPGHGQTRDLEWSGCDLDTVFAQRSNLLRPRLWRMLAELLRFDRLATTLARGDGLDALDESIGEFLDRERFGAEFREWYLLPMIGCIWSCPVDQMLPGTEPVCVPDLLPDAAAARAAARAGRRAAAQPLRPDQLCRPRPRRRPRRLPRVARGLARAAGRDRCRRRGLAAVLPARARADVQAGASAAS